jgi:lipid-binding SYLF domain-containing protein
MYTTTSCCHAHSGLCVSRLSDGSWSAPVAVRSFGISYGLQAGLTFTDYIVVLNTDAAVELFKVRNQVIFQTRRTSSSNKGL